MTATLLADVYSNFKTADKKAFIRYGKKGQKVTVIAVRGNVAILEDSNGFRFPSKKYDVLSAPC